MSTNYSKCRADNLFKAIPTKNWTDSGGSKKLRLPEFLDNQYMRVGRLSALRTGRLYSSGDIPCTHLYQRLSRAQGHSADGR